MRLQSSLIPDCCWTLILLVAACASLAVCPPGTLRAQQDTTFQVREVFRVGGSGDRTNFTEVTDIVARGDNLIVLDRRESRLVEIGEREEFVREIGRKGEGPGEFRSASVAGVMDDGDLWVID